MRITKWLTGNRPGAAIARLVIGVLAALGVVDTAQQAVATDAVACLEEALRSD